MSAQTITHGRPLWSGGMMAVLASQFLSAMADNALLFAALALLRVRLYPQWTQPLLQEFFVAAYILLAPFAGPFADAVPKGRVMLLSNALKLAGAASICLGANPFFAYGLVGVGAASYSPAKYGILSELTSVDQLVKANGLIESSTIAAILAGAVAGGTLADWNVLGALIVVSLLYASALLATLFIPRLPPAHTLASFSVPSIMRDFGRALRGLLRVREARLSISGTSIFWGTGATMRFLLVAWVPVALGITNNRVPAYLNAMVAVGIVAGAALAAKLVPLEKAERALGGGILIGVALCVVSVTSSLPLAMALLAVVGAAGGFFVVPLNALLQEKGQESVGSGHAIAIQNLAENAAMLVMIGVYMVIMRLGANINGVASGFGVLLTLGIGALWLYAARRARRTPSAGETRASAYADSNE